MNDRPANFMPAERRAVEDEIERLIGLLDGIDGDENLEATGDGEPSLGWTANGLSALSPDHRIDDDREQEVCDEPHDAADSGDDEFSLGWSEEGSLVGNLTAGSLGIEGELEPEFGWTEEIDQVRRQEVAGWLVDGGEPTLGFVDHGTGWTREAVYDDDREDVSEDEGAQDDREPDTDGEPFLGWTESLSISGGNGMCQGDEFSRFGNGEAYFDGDGYLAAKDVLRNLRFRRPDIRQEHVPTSCSIGSRAALQVDGLTITGKGIRETATHLPDETVMRSFAPEEGMVPEIDLLAHYRATHGSRP